MAQQTVNFKVSVAWWIKPYIVALVFFSFVTGCDYDEEKLERIIKKAVKVKFS